MERTFQIFHPELTHNREKKDHGSSQSLKLHNYLIAGLISFEPNVMTGYEK